MPMADLHHELTALAREQDLPPVPDLAPRVRARLFAGSARRRTRRRLVLALAATLILLLAVMAAVPSARDEVLDFIGIDGATVEVRPELPDRRPADKLNLGERVTLDQARASADFDVLVPGELGQPQAVFMRTGLPGTEVTLTYDDNRLLVTELRGDLAPEYVGKITSAGGNVKELRGAVYVSGPPHFVFFRTPDGGIRDESLRLSQDALLYERGRLLVRIEGAGSLRRALAIARSLDGR
jgi:hypothetical protein